MYEVLENAVGEQKPLVLGCSAVGIIRHPTVAHSVGGNVTVKFRAARSCSKTWVFASEDRKCASYRDPNWAESKTSNRRAGCASSWESAIIYHIPFDGNLTWTKHSADSSCIQVIPGETFYNRRASPQNSEPLSFHADVGMAMVVIGPANEFNILFAIYVMTSERAKASNVKPITRNAKCHLWRTRS